MKVLFFGTPLFAARVLEELSQQGIEIVGVISKPDKPLGRSGHPLPVPVKTVAEKRGLPLLQPPFVSSSEFASTLEAFGADLFVVVAYGEILKDHVLKMPPKGCINLHASLLPKYRGAAPIQRVIMHGEEKSGVSIMHMVKKMDAGDVIAMAEVPISLEMTFGELEEALFQAGSPLLLEVLRAFEKGEPPATPQDHTQMTLAPKVELVDTEVKWEKPASELHNLIRGVNPEPGAWCWVKWKGERKRLRLFRSRLIEKEGLLGTFLEYGKQGMVVATGKGALDILDVQLEGKNRMSGREFACGYQIKLLINTS